MTHTSECIQAQVDFDRASKAWQARWPRHCLQCGGWGGGGYSYDPSPAGVGLSPGQMWEWEPCPSCTGQGLCGRCTGAIKDASLPCPHCGWNHDDGRPATPECWC